ncbi:thiol peroxidase, thioredoxin-dependent [uncultured Desulfobacterium sp.]|uniref:thioredoxin-dependent peroxiredoxin n=1 Tax=uncultured Desulfobacterium sp. TaxID=201089 RepID=A0A445MXT4_9BACT|nr:thiol peroxidase, thioredoxin-dependent [uncultured Desulfobacterium sp.]
MAKLKKGDKAPGFNLTDQNGKKVKLSDFKGKILLLYFYPKANTGGCTKQAIGIRDAKGDLDRLGVIPVGISPDPPDTQKKFEAKHDLGFSLLSDLDHKVADAYGAWGEKSMYGKKYEGIIRSSFLISQDARIMEAWYKVSPQDTVPKALNAMP